MIAEYPTLESPPTPTQLRVIRAYVRLGSYKLVAAELGISHQTVKNHLSNLYLRLDVGSSIGALERLGWIAIPGTGPTPCGWIGYCSRARRHRGHHGGMRAFVRTEALA
jgi:DNA-binding CsgD family transcriptional regulator